MLKSICLYIFRSSLEDLFSVFFKKRNKYPGLIKQLNLKLLNQNWPFRHLFKASLKRLLFVHTVFGPKTHRPSSARCCDWSRGCTDGDVDEAVRGKWGADGVKTWKWHAGLKLLHDFQQIQSARKYFDLSFIPMSRCDLERFALSCDHFRNALNR